MNFKFHIWEKSTDKKAICGNTDTDNALYVDNYLSSRRWFYFFIYNWKPKEISFRCQHCEKKLKDKMRIKK